MSRNSLPLGLARLRSASLDLLGVRSAFARLARPICSTSPDSEQSFRLCLTTPYGAKGREMSPAPKATRTSILAARGGRDLRTIRPVEITPGFHRLAEGSLLYRAGGTVVLATASIEESVPDFLVGKGKGWITADYQMHPRANPKRRENRDGRDRPLGGRAREIQRLIGRSLRAAVDLDRLGEKSIHIDCDILEADGGTRTASVTAGFIALALACDKLTKSGKLNKAVLRDQVAAVSAGHVAGEYALDLCYIEDSSARVDLNVVATANGAIVEVQGTAEGEAVPRSDIDAMIDLALEGIRELCSIQRRTLEGVGVDLDALLMPRKAAI